MKRILSFAIIVVLLGTALFLTKTAKADEYAQGKKLSVPMGSQPLEASAR